MMHIAKILLGCFLIFIVFACVTMMVSRDTTYVTVDNLSYWDANVAIYCNNAYHRTIRVVTTRETRPMRLAACTQIDAVIDLIGSPRSYPIRGIAALTPGDTLVIQVGATINLSTYWIRPGVPGGP